MTEKMTGHDTLSRSLAPLIQSAFLHKTSRAVLLTTRDRDFALCLVRKTVAESRKHPDFKDLQLYHFTVAGRRRMDFDGGKGWEIIGHEQSEAFGLFQNATELKGGGVVVFEECLPFLADKNGDVRLRMSLAQTISSENTRPGLVLAFLESTGAEANLPSILSEQFLHLEVPYPRAGELETISREELSLFMARTGKPLEISQIRQSAARLAPEIVGLTRSAARDALRDSLMAKAGDIEHARQFLLSRKTDHLRRELAMNVLPALEDESPIGLDFLLAYLEVTRGKMALNGPGRAKGILLIGPPGTGKTMLARGIGQKVGLPVIEFRISSLMNSFLGETERRFSQAFATLEAMSPNVVFIDEIEKAFGDSSERDGGTMMRVTGSLLSWLSDNPNPNFIVATSNNLRRMGEIGLTMTRSERFDAAFFVDVPSLASRQAMLAKWLGKIMAAPAEAAREVARMTEKFSGADLRSICKQAQARAQHQNVPLETEHLVQEANRKRNRALALYDEFQELRRWGRIYCDPAGPVDEA